MRKTSFSYEFNYINWKRTFPIATTLNELQNVSASRVVVKYSKINGQRWDLTSAGIILNASAILAYNSLTLENPSILPVGLPWASCVWKTSLGRRLAGGGGSPAPLAAVLFKVPAPACPPLTSSLSTKCSLVALFFFLHGPNGILLLFSVCLSTAWKKEKKKEKKR